MSYFLYLIPDETGATYTDEETVEYTLTLSKLPSNILDWFNNLFDQPDPEPYYHYTLGTECPLGLWTIAGPDAEEEDKPDHKFGTYAELFEYLKEHVSTERDTVVNPNSIIFTSTMEFDWQYAFFDAQAVLNGELGKYLQPYLAISETGEVSLTTNKVVLSAYLD
jgi:hypothetical protein